ncbi:MAG TPA: septal ring lytic transglycosylase RlpA family lipoprotein [Ignavibacteriales bacterium]|nr:septal ring lytic transglycosylase RlpA family lipoprotein [Ignavibacteriales bacterium]
MKIKLIIYPLLILFSLIIYSCSSASRYTKSNDTNGNDLITKYDNMSDVETGTASFYADEFNGRTTANGELYDMNDLTAAHPTYPFNTIVKVTNLTNGKIVEVRINDRMPQFKGRIIDLSLAAAKKIGMIDAGIQNVRVEVIRWGK